MRCALCHKPIRGKKEYWAEIEYDFSLAVGPDCFKRIQAAGDTGLPRPGTNDRLYPEGTWNEAGKLATPAERTEAGY